MNNSENASYQAGQAKGQVQEKASGMMDKASNTAQSAKESAQDSSRWKADLVGEVVFDELEVFEIGSGVKRRPTVEHWKPSQGRQGSVSLGGGADCDGTAVERTAEFSLHIN
ncbi:hypothetical protein LINPERPRIM_LOCUS8962 [Linum perenne]